MSQFPGSPRLVKGGILLIDPVTSAVRWVTALQYKPNTLACPLQTQNSRGSRVRRQVPCMLNEKPMRSQR
jgi:hypothetical protein